MEDKTLILVFVSQPMNGIEYSEIQKNMDGVREMLNKIHPEDDVVFHIIDNYHHFNISDRLPMTASGKRIAFLGASIQKLAFADLVIFVKGWEEANGCKVEREIVDRYGIPWYYMGNFDISPGTPAWGILSDSINDIVKHKRTLEYPYNA